MKEILGELWLMWVKNSDGPLYESYHGNTYCFFCGGEADSDAQTHDENCIWAKTQKILEEE